MGLYASGRSSDVDQHVGSNPTDSTSPTTLQGVQNSGDGLPFCLSTKCRKGSFNRFGG